MKKSIKSHRSLMGLIYALFMLFPLLSFANRFLYVTFNDNAFESYSDNGIVEKTYNVSSTGTLAQGQLYTLTIDNTVGNINQNSARYKYSTISIDWTDYGAPSGNDYVAFSTYRAVSTYYLYLYDSNGTTLYTFWNGGVLPSSWSFIASEDFAQNGSQNFRLITSLFGVSKLDNNFEYSMKSFIDNHGTGVLDLTSWFTNQFISVDDTHALLYINFINWYMNYTLLVSCVYLLYAVLMWFLTWARRILSKGLDEGGIY